MDVNEELKFWGKFTRKIWGGVGSEGGGWVGGGHGECERKIEVFVKIQKKKFGGGVGGGVGGDVPYGGCEPRVEGIVQGTNRYWTILRK